MTKAPFELATHSSLILSIKLVNYNREAMEAVWRSPNLAAAAHYGSNTDGVTKLTTDPASYKQGMRRLASGVTIIATEHKGERFGLLSTGVASVSADPPVLLACINRSASSHDPVAHSGRFCVNVLAPGDQELAARFGSSQTRAGRFANREWQQLATGAPALVGCLASFDCVVARALAADTHTIFFGSVAEVRLWSETMDPLLYWDGSFRVVS